MKQDNRISWHGSYRYNFAAHARSLSVATDHHTPADLTPDYRARALAQYEMRRRGLRPAVRRRPKADR